ncbi:NADH-quinone oxidoreductase subunit J [Extensimonas vulgaris]|jgi:NADH-quinone oxidoreductase subunit J|uniref:NADH-quinone oxidoreductase subunit J n=1 Tax=Extensimonas vulgaris TaxID=1031594 RepID=A0A369AMX0_9BURK|nr:NADH-quinone oxidoreductase subunit J [Extensimonas vulgaris]RCX09537.1 NADH dehydrogenase subunit J [Extensimonas vulgaris]TWI38667.1 NADH-quinone oxidoreductase subunit J [Extensimonas vulgaris]TXD14488.1 NADH-quinone oxidoreductase subunit J [Extensimonas vulgaris]
MDAKTGFFYFFSIVLLFAAFRVVTARNPVHAVLYLILAFAQAAGLWMLLKAEFLAIALVLVYLGAVMVLFLFVVMMLDMHVDTARKGFWNHFPLAVTIGALIALEMAAVLMGGFRGVEEPKTTSVVMNSAESTVQASNVKALGKLLYTEYLYPIEIAAIILLVAMIAAIALTLRRRKDSKMIDPSKQVHVRAADRLTVLKITSTPRTGPVNDVPIEEKKI